MAIPPLAKAVLGIVTALDPDVTKTYKIERQLEIVAKKLRSGAEDCLIWDKTVLSEDGYEVPVRIFAPRGSDPTAVLLYFHGGGWVSGSIERYAGVLTDLAKAVGVPVAAADYRLAPEHKYPAALNDCYAVMQSFLRGDFLGVRGENVTVMGDSAGGNLAAAAALKARDRGEPIPRNQILLYPVAAADHGEDSPFESVRENGTGCLLTAKRMEQFTRLYQNDPADRRDPYFAPLNARDFSRQPRTLLISAEYCPLRDEGEHYAARLREAGGDVTVYRMPDALHGFLMLPPAFAPVRKTHRLIREFLGRGNPA